MILGTPYYSSIPFFSIFQLSALMDAIQNIVSSKYRWLALAQPPALPPVGASGDGAVALGTGVGVGLRPPVGVQREVAFAIADA